MENVLALNTVSQLPLYAIAALFVPVTWLTEHRAADQ